MSPASSASDAGGRAPIGGSDDGAPPAGAARDGGPAGGRPYILSLGRAEPRKDLPLLVRAFDQVADQHPDVDLVIAGPPGWMANTMRSFSASKSMPA